MSVWDVVEKGFVESSRSSTFTRRTKSIGSAWKKYDDARAYMHHKLQY